MVVPELRRRPTNPDELPNPELPHLQLVPQQIPQRRTPSLGLIPNLQQSQNPSSVPSTTQQQTLQTIPQRTVPTVNEANREPEVTPTGSTSSVGNSAGQIAQIQTGFQWRGLQITGGAGVLSLHYNNDTPLFFLPVRIHYGGDVGPSVHRIYLAHNDV